MLQDHAFLSSGNKMFNSAAQSSRYKPLNPINTVIMFVPQQQVRHRLTDGIRMSVIADYLCVFLFNCF